MIKEVHGGNIYKYDRQIYDFSANLNPLGMADEVKKAIADAVDTYQPYPDPFNRELKKAVSQFHNIDEDLLVFGNGAADIIFRIPLALKPEKALIVEPTFSEYEEGLKLAGCQVDYFPLSEEEGFHLDAERLAAQVGSYDICYICNPNNPTGVPVKREDMLKIAQACELAGTWLVVDQCFSDFMTDEESYSIAEDLEDFSIVIVLKAFTKIFAMAGIRLGYALCSDRETAEAIYNAGQPWSVSTPASVAGCAALGVEGYVEKTKVYIERERQILMDALKEMGLKTYDSRTNYIFFRTDKDIFTPLEEHNIVIRKCGNYPLLDSRYYRIAVRTAEENQYFIRALREVLAEK